MVSRPSQVIGKIATALSTEAEQTPINKEIHHFIQIISPAARWDLVFCRCFRRGPGRRDVPRVHDWDHRRERA